MPLKRLKGKKIKTMTFVEMFLKNYWRSDRELKNYDELERHWLTADHDITNVSAIGRGWRSASDVCATKRATAQHIFMNFFRVKYCSENSHNFGKYTKYHSKTSE